MKRIAFVLMAVLLVLVFVGSCDAQSNTRTRQIRFATGVQYASDTTEGLSPNNNSGRIWYDFDTDKFRANQGGINSDLLGGGGGSFWPLSGSANITGNVQIIGDETKDIYIASGGDMTKGFFIDYSTGAGLVMGNSNTQLIGSLIGDNTGIKFNDDRFNGPGFEYSADYSANYTSRSMVDKGFVTGGFINNSTTNEINTANWGVHSTLANNTLNVISINDFWHTMNGGVEIFVLPDGSSLVPYFNVTEQNKAIFGIVNYGTGNSAAIEAVTDGTTKSFLKIQTLPTANPCADPLAGTGTIWNDAGTLKICP